MAVNRGKKFEEVIRKSFEHVNNTLVIRIPDQTAGYLGAKNICDFVVYHYPFQYLVECKTVHGNTLSFNNITNSQWYGLLEANNISGVKAGILCWWVDKDITKWLPISMLSNHKKLGYKSIRYDDYSEDDYILYGEKKRVFFDYDMEDFFNAMF